MTITAPRYNDYVAIAKSDSVNFAEGPCDAIYIGGAGIVVAVSENDNTTSFTCVAGQVLPISAKRVNSTNTSATLMVALYSR